MVVDITVGSATQLVFVLVGVGLLTADRTDDAAATAWVFTAGAQSSPRRSQSSSGSSTAACLACSSDGLTGWRRRAGCPASPGRADSDRRRCRRDVPPAPRPFVFERAAARRVGERDRRGLADDVGLGQAAHGDRFLHPRKPKRRRPRRSVHGAGSLGRSGGGSRPVRRAARRPAGSGAGGFSHKKGSRAGARPAGLAAWQWIEGQPFVDRSPGDKASSTSP